MGHGRAIETYLREINRAYGRGDATEHIVKACVNLLARGFGDEQ